MRQRYAQAFTFGQFLDAAASQQRHDMWRAVYEHARVPAALLRRVQRLQQHFHLLILAEDWCGDASNIVPVLARLAEASHTLDLRILRRDENADLMDAHLTGTSRSIPVVIVLDTDYCECGWWGPRPAELQSWFVDHGRQLPRLDRYREIRRYYARDHGRTTLEEVVALLEKCDGRSAAA
jgi:Thioredoxin